MRLKNFFKIYKVKNAQALVEFAIVAPILILFLLLIIQFGYAINIRNVLSAGAKESLMKVNSQYNNLTGATLAAKKTAMETALKANMATFLTAHSIPNTSSVTVKLKTDANGVTYANFTYLYKLALPLIPGMPVIPLQSSQIINTDMIQVNNFNSSLSTQQLSAFFSTPRGALTTSGYIGAYGLHYKMAFLVSWYDDYNISNVAQDNYARLFSLWGADLLPPNERINVRTATIEVRSPYYNGGDWFNTQIPYVWVVSALGYTQVFYTKYNSTSDVRGGIGYTLNTTDVGNHYWAAPLPNLWKNSNPLVWGQGNNPATWYPSLYRTFPADYDNAETDPTDATGFGHQKFMRSLGYRWCAAAGVTNSFGTAALCHIDQTGTHSIQELALKGISREGHKCVGHGLNFSYKRLGNYESVKNSGLTDISKMQHYTVRTSDYNNFDGNYVINIYQPVVRAYYTAGTDDVDPAKIILNDTNTTDANGNSTPFFTAFKWKFRLTPGGATKGIYEAGGAATHDIVDVYIDADGDGIPDAWDDRPTYFDANRNGILDGLESSVGFNAAADTQIDKYSLSAPYDFPVPGINQVFGGVTYGPLIATPFAWLGAYMDSRKNNPALSSLIPEFNYSRFLSYMGGLYIQCDADADASNDDLCRQYPSWGSAGGTGSILGDKERFINGTISGANIDLNQSDDLIYLNANNFSAGNHVTRTPAGW